MELSQVTTVQDGGRIEAVFPSLTPGQLVEVVVRSNGSEAPTDEAKGTMRFGFARNQIWMSEDFDAPLDEFRDYM